MVDFEVRLDSKAVEQYLSRLGSNMPTVASRAINRTIASAQTLMKREISSDIGIKVGVVAKQLKVSKASRTKLSASLKASGKRIPLIELGAKGPEPSRGKGRGITYRRGGRTVRISKGFIARMPSGHRGVFKRFPGVAVRTRDPRKEGIRELFGPSISLVFSKKLPKVQREVEQRFELELDRAIQSIL